MTIQEFYDEIWQRVADGEFAIKITDEGDYWHDQTTKLTHRSLLRQLSSSWRLAGKYVVQQA